MVAEQRCETASEQARNRAVKHSDNVPVLRIMETQRPGYILEKREEQVDVPASGEGIQEHVAEEVIEVFVPQVMKENVEVTRWIPQTGECPTMLRSGDCSWYEDESTWCCVD